MGGKRGRGERSTPAQTNSGGGERAGMELKRGKTKLGCRETLGGNNVWVGGHVSELFFLRSGLLFVTCICNLGRWNSYMHKNRKILHDGLLIIIAIIRQSN
jgi:hypothetical protein